MGALTNPYVYIQGTCETYRTHWFLGLLNRPFRVPETLTFKTGLSAKPLLCNRVFICMRIKKLFSYHWLPALGFALKQRLRATRKWPIIYQNSSHDYQKKQRAQRRYLWPWLPSNCAVEGANRLIFFWESKCMRCTSLTGQTASCELVTNLVKLSRAPENCKR